jgi:hypothetical protein
MRFLISGRFDVPDQETLVETLADHLVPAKNACPFLSNLDLKTILDRLGTNIGKLERKGTCQLLGLSHQKCVSLTS